MNQLVLIAIILGIAQGLFEWLPISSEGALTLLLTVLYGNSMIASVQFALFLHVGTAFSAILYYRGEIGTLLRSATHARDDSEFLFLTVATVASGCVGIGLYLVVRESIRGLDIGASTILIGVLLLFTGIAQRTVEGRGRERNAPSILDGFVVGAAQGLAILPGVSRSGMTTSVLLLRGHSGESSFRLSFLLSIPAALGAGLLVMLDGGIPTLPVFPAVLALTISLVIGYLTIDALMRTARIFPFWIICLGFGLLTLTGGLLTIV